MPEIPATEDGSQMKSLVPEGAVIPPTTIPAETQRGQLTQADLDKAAETRGGLIEQLG